MKIYEINEMLRSIIDTETGEIDENAYELFESLSIEREEKLENLAVAIKEMNADAEAIEAEIKKLQARRDAVRNKAEYWKDYLKSMLNGEKLKSPRVVCSYRKSESVKVTNMARLQLWAEATGRTECLRYSAPTENKTEIKNLLKQGLNVEGAELVENQSLIIK